MWKQWTEKEWEGQKWKVPKSVNKTCSVHLMLLSCMWVQGWPLGIGYSIRGLILGEDFFSHSQQYPGCFCLWVGPRVLPSMLVCLLVLYLLRSCISSYVMETFWISSKLIASHWRHCPGPTYQMFCSNHGGSWSGGVKDGRWITEEGRPTWMQVALSHNVDHGLSIRKKEKVSWAPTLTFLYSLIVAAISESHHTAPPTKYWLCALRLWAKINLPLGCFVSHPSCYNNVQSKYYIRMFMDWTKGNRLIYQNRK